MTCFKLGCKGIELQLHLTTQGACGILMDGKCGTLVAWQHPGVAAGVCFISRACSVILLQVFARQMIVFKKKLL